MKGRCYLGLTSPNTKGRFQECHPKQSLYLIHKIGISFMLNKYFYQNKAKLYQNLKNITLLKIPLTLVLGTSGSRQRSKSYKHMAKPTEYTSQNKSYMHANDLGKTCWKSKHCFTCQEDMLGTNQVFAEVPHLLAEVWLPRLRRAAACRGAHKTN